MPDATQGVPEVMLFMEHQPKIHEWDTVKTCHRVPLDLYSLTTRVNLNLNLPLTVLSKISHQANYI